MKDGGVIASDTVQQGGTLRKRDPERTRAEILAVSTEVFAAQGYSGARVDEIADRTRTTKRMIYYYFGSKEQLYLAVLKKAYSGIREAERAIQVDSLKPTEAIRQLAELTYDHHVRHSDFIRLVMIENIHRGVFIRQIDSIRDLAEPAVGILDEILERGQAEGVFRHDVDAFDVHLLISAYCVFQVANQYTFGYLFGRDLHAPPLNGHLRSMLGDVVAAWLLAPEGTPRPAL
ncbi:MULTISPECIES: TetR/AcrR family transcriptional regulator [unclassified Arthrobacter]|uniref:TetR/AcrR family transcriptional regulator n=1 Tax=unclassified Arthrobacter TaxID=235627 RepID=UPI001E28283C|nr:MULTISPECIES: TetR/AcrR family transcriptional regulator [unclassified Arthrobacter]MCC9144623.1 TetR family transcriptional regulator [Arthrobacter sp. zg-Y919]MDK1275849.1 TetR/AcrR family transcriptional regulator [Arthrobacter sp. zg.Y919]MDM7991481.1 TetR/AcrR family transcriptional regulator [Arthrobacter sp. zg-Y877]WIB02788.1 TetR/AcrR family transcriptional regulator [Arthrobacter sp. zg-Y919]